MSVLKSVNIFLFIISAAVWFILQGTLVVVLWKRLVERIKWTYNEWLIINWLISAILLLIFQMVQSIWQNFDSSVSVYFGTMSWAIMWVFSNMFQVLNAVYPLLLIIYYSKLSDLRKKTFKQVKTWINRVEFMLIIVSLVIIFVMAFFNLLPRILYISYSWNKDDSGDMCNVSKKLSDTLYYFAIVFDAFFALAQTLIFLWIKITMRRKLYFFYNRAIKELKIIFVCNEIFLLTNLILLTIALRYNKYLHFYLKFESENMGENCVFLVVGSIQRILLSVYIYFTTKYIDLEFCIRMLMFGYRVLNQYDKMSLFITKSWFRREVEDENENIEDDATAKEICDFYEQNSQYFQKKYTEC